MNNDRRKEIARVQTEIETVKDFIVNEMEREESAIEEQVGKLDDLRGEIETLKGEEEEYKENMPQSFQDGDKGAKADFSVEQMDEAMTKVGEMIDKLEALKTALEELNELDGLYDEAMSALDSAAE